MSIVYKNAKELTNVDLEVVRFVGVSVVDLGNGSYQIHKEVPSLSTCNFSSEPIEPRTLQQNTAEETNNVINNLDAIIHELTAHRDRLENELFFLEEKPGYLKIPE